VGSQAGVDVNIIELTEAAIKSLNENTTSIPSSVILIMPGEWGMSNKKYLAGPKSPQGQIVQESYDKKLTVIFDAMDVLAWCVAKGANVEIVEIVSQPKKNTPDDGITGRGRG
jgi:hypothetical protein